MGFPSSRKKSKIWVHFTILASFFQNKNEIEFLRLVKSLFIKFRNGENFSNEYKMEMMRIKWKIHLPFSFLFILYMRRFFCWKVSEQNTCFHRKCIKTKRNLYRHTVDLSYIVPIYMRWFLFIAFHFGEYRNCIKVAKHNAKLLYTAYFVVYQFLFMFMTRSLILNNISQIFPLKLFVCSRNCIFFIDLWQCALFAYWIKQTIWMDF